MICPRERGQSTFQHTSPVKDVLAVSPWANLENVITYEKEGARGQGKGDTLNRCAALSVLPNAQGTERRARLNDGAAFYVRHVMTRPRLGMSAPRLRASSATTS